MPRIIRAIALAAAAGLALAGFAAPEADAQWRRNRGAVAAGVAAGVIGGVALGALAARQGSYGYHGGPVYGEPVYGGPAYGYAPGYEEEAVVVERPAYRYGYGYGSPQQRRVVTRPEGRNTMYDTIDRNW